MRSGWRFTLIPLFALSLNSCSDTTGPGDDQLVDMLLDFCSNEVPSFFAVRNGDGSFERVTANAAGTFSFRAGLRTTLIIVNQSGSSFRTDVVHASNTDLQPANGVECVEFTGNKTVSGTVTGLSSTHDARVTMALSSDFVFFPDNSFTLGGLPNGLLDLVAHRELFVVDGFVPDRVIIRRGLSLTSGAVISPELAFTDAAPPAEGTAAISGIASGDDASLFVDFTTAALTRHFLYDRAAVQNGIQPIYGVPTSLVNTGDMHVLDLFAQGLSSSWRGALQYYRNAGNRTVGLGAELNTPSITTVSTTGNLRLRATLNSQVDYGGFATVEFDQSAQSVERVVSITMTSAYAGGTPTAWELEVPNFASINGYPSTAVLQAGIFTDWFVEAWSALPTELVGGQPTEQSVRYAARFSGGGATQLRAVSNRGEARRPVHQIIGSRR